MSSPSVVGAPSARVEGAWSSAVAAWLVSRVLVIGSLEVAREVVERLGAPQAPTLRMGLHGWDAAYYADISTRGYDDFVLGNDGLRFFPLLPVLGRIVNAVTPAAGAQGVIVVANVAALFAFVLLHRFVARETGSATIARNAVWLAALAPPAFVFVMGYAESLFLLVSLGALDAARRHAWGQVVPWALAAALCRPPGVLLAVPIAIEGFRWWRSRPPGTRSLVPPLVAVGAAPAGLLAFLVWAADRGDGFFGPLRIHGQDTLRGPTRNPLASVWDALGDLRAGDRVGSGLHFLTALVAIGLVVVLARRAAGSLAGYALVSVALSLTASNLDSLERYTLVTVPLLLGAALVVDTPNRARAAITVGSGAMVALSILAFTGTLVP